MPLEAPVMRTSFAAMRGVFPTYQANVTGAAFPLTSLAEFCVGKVGAELWHKGYRRSRTAGLAQVRYCQRGPCRYILWALI